jgi:hypothetical protein
MVIAPELMASGEALDDQPNSHQADLYHNKIVGKIEITVSRITNSVIMASRMWAKGELVILCLSRLKPSARIRIMHAFDVAMSRYISALISEQFTIN